MKSLYYPQEHALICDYLGIPRPERLRDLDIWTRPSKWAKGIWPELHDRSALAVARIALGAVQRRLPQWAFPTSGGSVIEARQAFEVPERAASLLPVHLLTISWSCSGPGFDWPEAYHATWLPVFDVWIMTASKDSGDIAIGHFKGTLKASARAVLGDWWRRQWDSWEEFVDSGVFDELEAWALADEDWPPKQREGAACTA